MNSQQQKILCGKVLGKVKKFYFDPNIFNLVQLPLPVKYGNYYVKHYIGLVWRGKFLPTITICLLLLKLT